MPGSHGIAVGCSRVDCSTQQLPHQSWALLIILTQLVSCIWLALHSISDRCHAIHFILTGHWWLMHGILECACLGTTMGIMWGNVGKLLCQSPLQGNKKSHDTTL